MLTSLRIEHFAIVKHLELDFAQGMTAFTGETGAGKSIMIDALMLALGGRGDASAIRPEKKNAISLPLFRSTKVQNQRNGYKNTIWLPKTVSFIYDESFMPKVVQNPTSTANLSLCKKLKN